MNWTFSYFAFYQFLAITNVTSSFYANVYILRRGMAKKVNLGSIFSFTKFSSTKQ